MERSVHVRLVRLVEQRSARSVDRWNFFQQKVCALVTTLPHAGSAILVSLLEAVGVQASAMHLLSLVNCNVLAWHVSVVDQERGGCEACDAASDDMRFFALDALWGRCVDAVIVLHRSLLSRACDDPAPIVIGAPAAFRPVTRQPAPRLPLHAKIDCACQLSE